jgi:heme/copper-type cytochrome/quinol oxidase subunit 2
MTPLIGILIAVLVALFAPNVRGLVVSELALMAAATAVQTWDLGSGRGSNPADTIDQASYWFVQLIIIAIITALTLGIYRFRLRRAARVGRSPERPAFSGRRGASVLVMSVAAVTGLCLAVAFAMNSSHAHHGVGAGNIPWTGVLGMAIGLLALIGVGIAVVRGTNADNEARQL